MHHLAVELAEFLLILFTLGGGGIGIVLGVCVALIRRYHMKDTPPKWLKFISLGAVLGTILGAATIIGFWLLL